MPKQHVQAKVFIAALPKVETHLHLDGSLTPELIQELALDQNYQPFIGKTLKEISQITVVSRPWPSLAAVLSAFDHVLPLLQTAAALEKTAYALCRRAKQQNMIYMEVRFAPILNVKKNLSQDEVIRAVLNGLKRGNKDFGVESGLIITMLRNMSVKDNESMFETALKFLGKGVVGIDLANDESGRGLADFAHLYQEAKRAGLFTTVHAGEVYPSPDLKLAFDLGVDRVGHGLFLCHYHDLLQEFAGRKIPIEVNLTSNLRTGAIHDYKDHPILKFLESGIPVALSTDDPGLFGIDLNHEYEVLASVLGFAPRQLLELSLQSADCLFLPPQQKEAIKNKIRQAGDMC